MAKDAVKTWVKKACSALKRGHIHALLQKMQALADAATGKRPISTIRSALFEVSLTPQSSLLKFGSIHPNPVQLLRRVYTN